MTMGTHDNWKAIEGLVSEIKRCEECGITIASVVMAFICIDALANLGRAKEKSRVTRSDFKNWVDTHLCAHPDQPYKYRGKDVYAARCALLHKYGSEAGLHEEDSDTIKFIYHDGGEHKYNPNTDPSLVIIGTASFINDVVHGAVSFIKLCQSDVELKERVEGRLPSLLQPMPMA